MSTPSPARSNNNKLESDDSDDEFIVEAILDARNKDTEFLIKWQGFADAKDQTWEPLDSISDTDAYQTWISSRPATTPAVSAKALTSTRAVEEEEDYEDADDLKDDSDDDYQPAAPAESNATLAMSTPAASSLGKRNFPASCGVSMSTAKKPKAKKGTGCASKPVDVGKILMALSHKQLADSVASFLRQDPELQQRFMAALPVADVSDHVQKLDKASRAISRALPNSRFGSSSDHYGYKRCSSSVTAFKQLWNEQVGTLADGDKTAFAEYSSRAIEILKDSVSFDQDKDNKYKSLCTNKLKTALTKTLKAKELPLEIKTQITSSLTLLEAVY